jgi:hypothetical protein
VWEIGGGGGRRRKKWVRKRNAPKATDLKVKSFKSAIAETGNQLLALGSHPREASWTEKAGLKKAEKEANLDEHIASNLFKRSSGVSKNAAKYRLTARRPSVRARGIIGSFNGKLRCVCWSSIEAEAAIAADNKAVKPLELLVFGIRGVPAKVVDAGVRVDLDCLKGLGVVLGHQLRGVVQQHSATHGHRQSEAVTVG